MKALKLHWRDAGICENKSLYADYATNQMPPKYGIDLTLTQKLLDDALTVGGRISYTSSRAVGHGDVTGQGMSQFITLVDWQPYTLVDVFAEYKINDTYTASFRVENLTDRFYVDPLSLVLQPGPGRTFYASMTANF
jgi:hemoglobin/transferrin/lactoferrin receptor protein